MINKDRSWKHIVAEIAKCVVRCKDYHGALDRTAPVDW
jgi:hypothetical protein